MSGKKEVTTEHAYLTCNGNCGECSTPQRQKCITAACDGLTESVKDRRENGGTHQKIRNRAFDLIRVMVADLDM